MTKDKKANILVAEDSLAAAKQLEYTLERAGFAVEVVHNGSVAWTKAQEKQFDLVVTDEQMPVMSGHDLCRHLRNDDRYAHVPIIFLTAKLFELDKRELTEDLRVSITFGKPFSPNALVQAVESELSRSHKTAAS